MFSGMPLPIHSTRGGVCSAVVVVDIRCRTPVLLSYNGTCRRVAERLPKHAVMRKLPICSISKRTGECTAFSTLKLPPCCAGHARGCCAPDAESAPHCAQLCQMKAQALLATAQLRVSQCNQAQQVGWEGAQMQPAAKYSAMAEHVTSTVQPALCHCWCCWQDCLVRPNVRRTPHGAQQP